MDMSCADASPEEQQSGAHQKRAGFFGQTSKHSRITFPAIERPRRGRFCLANLGVTGEAHHVDASYHSVWMEQKDAPDIALM